MLRSAVCYGTCALPRGFKGIVKRTFPFKQGNDEEFEGAIVWVPDAQYISATQDSKETLLRTSFNFSSSGKNKRGTRKCLKHTWEFPFSQRCRNSVVLRLTGSHVDSTPNDHQLEASGINGIHLTVINTQEPLICYSKCIF